MISCWQGNDKVYWTGNVKKKKRLQIIGVNTGKNDQQIFRTEENLIFFGHDKLVREIIVLRNRSSMKFCLSELAPKKRKIYCKDLEKKR